MPWPSLMRWHNFLCVMPFCSRCLGVGSAGTAIKSDGASKRPELVNCCVVPDMDCSISRICFSARNDAPKHSCRLTNEKAQILEVNSSHYGRRSMHDYRVRLFT